METNEATSGVDLENIRQTLGTLKAYFAGEGMGERVMCMCVCVCVCTCMYMYDVFVQMCVYNLYTCVYTFKPCMCVVMYMY